MPNCSKARHIAKCLETAILFEVSANKPGNVNFVVGFEGTRVEHFLASAVAAAPSFEQAARRGIEIMNEKLAINEVGIGHLIKDCVADIAAWQTGGNTLLGTVMLFIPIAMAAGMTSIGNNVFDLTTLRRNIKLAVESTTAEDAVHVYEAIDIAKPSGLNGAPDLDVKAADSKTRLIKEDVSLFEVFKIAASYDDICFEWINNYPITFDMAYPYLMDQLKTEALNTAIIHTFLKVLAERPDTFISRKIGKAKAQEVSKEAARVLELGGVRTTQGKESIIEFDKKLRDSGNDYNPGTTADITAATLALCTLSGYRA
ncbi:MAG TPA: triphosphoribosyl-dephospho-CoA synthase [Candidatus Sulfotelmatobacter sp.]|nr:triphosphoribosyl-dephospho-CoA synthase [Candidatus Sulfotelmatobacter sp.]